MAELEPGARCYYRNAAGEYWPAIAFDVREDADYIGHLASASRPDDGAGRLDLKVTLPDGRVANRVGVPQGDEDGGWVSVGYHDAHVAEASDAPPPAAEEPEPIAVSGEATETFGSGAPVAVAEAAPESNEEAGDGGTA